MKKVADIRPGDLLVVDPVLVTRVEHTETQVVVHTADGQARTFALEGDPAVEVVEKA